MGETLRLLIVEDSEDDAAAMVRELRRGGFAPIHRRVESAEELREALTGQTWDLILSEHSTSRYQAANALAELGRLEVDLPFILVSSWVGEEHAQRVLDAGAWDYIPQGNLARLVSSVRRALNETGMRRQRKLADDALRVTESRLRQTIGQTPVVLWAVDCDLRFTLSSKNQQVVGTNLVDFLGAEEGDLPILAHRRALGGESVSYEWEYAGRAYDCHVEPLRDQRGEIVGVTGVALDITERRRAEQSMSLLVEALSGALGEEFFRRLVASLGKALEADYAFVGELVQADQEISRTVAVWARGQIVDNLEYALAGTPCANVVGRELCYYPSGVQEQFPEDRLLVDMGVDSYMGVPLFASAGRPLGLLVVLGSGTLRDPEHARAILQICALRASSELERLQAERELRDSRQNYEDLVNTMDGIVWKADPKTFLFSFVSKQAKKLLGYPVEQWLASPGFWVDHIHPDDRQWVVDYCIREIGEKRAHEMTYRMVAADGRDVWLRDIVTVIVENDEAVEVRGVMVDVSERIRLEDELKHNALHDTLTGLPNRALFDERLDHALKRYRRSPGRPFAVLFLDLDRFKVINDSLGHQAGDHLLIGIAARLIGCLRDGDTVARLGGDEFAVLLEDLRDTAETIQVAERIQAALRDPFHHDGQEIFTTASIGIAVSHPGMSNPRELVRDADTAMYRAKERGRACYAVFDAGMHAHVVALLSLEADLRRAVARGEFEIHYQKIQTLADGRLKGLEALLRWRHPTRGLLHPADFLPAAEETGLIVPIGWWTLEEACRRMAHWQRLGRSQAAFTVSVNLSGRQCAQPDLVERLSDILDQAGLAHERLTLEITETVAMQHEGSIEPRLRALKALGVGLQLDDFGTGYSSLSRLHSFPIDTLKIDRSFVESIRDSQHISPIVVAIIELARHLGIATIAEGVETEFQCARLRELGCEAGQGNYFSPPLVAEQVDALVQSSFGAVTGA